MRVVLQSRIGNIVIGILGVLYAISSIALFIYYVIDTWGAAGMIDRALQAVLIVAAAAGIFFILTAVRNLGLNAKRRASQPHSAGAASSS